MSETTVCQVIHALGGRRGLRDRRVMECYLAARKFDRRWIRGFGYSGPITGLMTALEAARLASDAPQPQPKDAA